MMMENTFSFCNYWASIGAVVWYESAC